MLNVFPAHSFLSFVLYTCFQLLLFIFLLCSNLNVFRIENTKSKKEALKRLQPLESSSSEPLEFKHFLRVNFLHPRLKLHDEFLHEH